jgi:hypothetical protein
MAPQTVDEYLRVLDGELRFDRRLARRVRAEVEDHLCEAAEVHGERAALARFGAPHELAAQFAAVSLSKRARFSALWGVISIVAAFALMEARLRWYAVHHWQATQGLAIAIDRYAFLAGGAAALTGLICLLAWRAVGSHVFERTSLLWSVLLSAAATTCALAALIADACITALRIAHAPWSTASTLPLIACLVECALAVLLVLYLQRVRASIRKAAA